MGDIYGFCGSSTSEAGCTTHSARLHLLGCSTTVTQIRAVRLDAKTKREHKPVRRELLSDDPPLLTSR